MSKKRENDDLFTQVYNKFEGPLPELQFLNAVFSFLNRQSNILAQPGITKQITNIVQKHVDAAKQKGTGNQQTKPAATTTTTSTNTSSSTTSSSETTNDKSKNEKTGNTNETTDNKQNEKKEDTKENTKKPNDKPTETKTSDKKSGKNEDGDKEKDEDEKDSGSPPPEGNGGKTDRYVWTQTLNETEIKLQVPPHCVAKDLDVTITENSIRVRIKKTNEILFEGEPREAVDSDEAQWTLDQEHGAIGKTVTLVLPKKKDMSWWDSAIKGDPKINTKKICPENSKLSDLDDDTRTTVEKMMFDQRQKAMGKPTSKELEHQETLDKFKKMHPELDFSQVKNNQF